MSGCIICGAQIPEGLQMCERCAEIFTEHADVMAAMFNKSPVEHEGITYGCISAFTIRTRASHIYKLNEPYILQVELMSKRGCVVWADPKKIKILREGRQ